MNLGRELLVVLLAVTYSVAQQSQPKVLDVDMFSHAHLPKEPHMQHLQFQRRLSNSLRRSMASKEKTCVWDTGRKICLLSTSKMTRLLENSDAEFAKMVVESFNCMEKTNRVSCNKQTLCAWRDDVSGCEYQDLRRSHEDSPCARAGPIFFDLAEAAALCPKQNSSGSCESMKQCQWNTTYDTCEVDHYSIVYGVKELSNQQSRVLDPVLQAFGEEYRSPLYSHNATLEDFNDYLLSKIQCPLDVEPFVCSYVYAHTTHLLVPTLYCHAKYRSSASNCTVDDLCEWNEASDSCVLDAAVRGTGIRAAERVNLDAIPDGIYKQLRENFITCDTIYNQTSCNGTCSWNPIADTCVVTRTSVITPFTQAAMSSTDALCDFLRVHKFSRCHFQHSEKKCERKTHCRWSWENGCEPRIEVYISVAAAEDPRLKRMYTGFKKQCSSRTNEVTC